MEQKSALAKSDPNTQKKKSASKPSSALKKENIKPSGSKSGKGVKKSKSRSKSKKRVKSPDPEVLKAQYEEWTKSEEYKKWNEIAEIRRNLNEITETTDDITGPWQASEDKLFKFAKLFKLKKIKLKELKHEYIRSIFFAREDKDNKGEWKLDGVVAGVSKEYSDAAWHLRKKFVQIWNAFDMASITDENLGEVRKKLGKDFQEFFKEMEKFIKKPHKVIYMEKLSELVMPLNLLMKSNFRLSAFEQTYASPEEREVVDFKYKTLIKRFCIDLKETQRILNELEPDPQKSLIFNPNPNRIFKKLWLKDWESRPAEFFYLSKLRQALFMMRKNLIKLFTSGIDFWRIPLSSNSLFLSDLRKLVDSELLAERLLGNDLRRDQLDFFYNCIKVVLESPGNSKLLAKEDTFVKLALPKLLVFNQVQRIRKIMDLEEQERKKKKIEYIQGGVFFQFSVDKIDRDASEMEESRKNERWSGKSRSVLAREETRDFSYENGGPNEEILNKYGRVWIFENYIDDSLKKNFFNLADQIKNINAAVQQDIQDLLITEGLNLSKEILLHREKYKDEIKKAREDLERIKIMDNKKDKDNNIRPPILWNDPIVWENKHEYRSVAAPYECYKDERIYVFLKEVDFLAEILSNEHQEDVEDLIGRVIDIFNNQYNQSPTPNSIYLGLYKQDEEDRDIKKII